MYVQWALLVGITSYLCTVGINLYLCTVGITSGHYFVFMYSGRCGLVYKGSGRKQKVPGSNPDRTVPVSSLSNLYDKTILIAPAISISAFDRSLIHSPQH